MKPSKLTRKIEELSEKLKPMPLSEGIRIDFKSLTEPEQLVILKNFELDEKYRDRWTKEVFFENKDLIVKCNHIVIDRVIELFLFAMPRALVLDEVEQWFFKFHFHEFLRHWIECHENVKKWSKQEREDFLRDVQVTESMKHRKEVKSNGKENNN
jgi:hypothetical protein